MSQAADLAKAALARGNLIVAYDLTSAAIEDGDNSGAVRHQQVLVLARMGDTERAMDLFASYGLDRSNDTHERAIGARLLKDRALAARPGPDRQQALARAYEAYRAIYDESGDSYPGINAATLALLAGDGAQSRALADALLADAVVAAGRDYYKAATRAEALLLLGRTEEVAETLARNVIRASDDHGGRSSTRRQLAMVADHLGIGEVERATLLAPLVPPRTMHFCGHMFAADPDAEARLRHEIDDILAQENVGFAFGALACGGDLLIAEAAVSHGIELNVVLPLSEEDFLAQSVLPGGESWEARYRFCLAQAANITFASELEFFGDPHSYGYAGRMAMGLARLRAAGLAGDTIQLAVWDGVPGTGPAGTGSDVGAWTARGGRSRSIPPGRVNRKLSRPEPRVDTSYERTFAAILFTDFKGFSTLAEPALPAFWDGVMRVVAEILDEHAEEVISRNSWGDALYAVATSAPAAAEIALQLQDRLSAFDYTPLGLADTGGMRIGAHYGPAYRAIDHITGRTTFYGTEVSKTARIEPVTPPGAVFVTEPFAAILALEAGDRFHCGYVGRIALPKKYGDLPMYRLSRRC